MYEREVLPLMKKKNNYLQQGNNADSICFGLDRQTDERSLALFVKKFANDRMLNRLIPRMTEDEIMELVDFLTRLMHNHLQHKEYHEVFFNE